jgi:PAS domain S-box-containing protein
VPTRTATDPLALLALEDPELLLDAVTVTDADGTIQAVNRAFTRLHGYEPHEVVGRRPSLLSSGLHPVSFSRQLWETISAGRAWAGELIDRAADGTLRTIRSQVNPVRGPGGRITHYVALQREVTPDGTHATGQLRLDLRGRCTYADRAAARLLQPDGDPVELLGPGLLQTLQSADAAALREVVEHATETARTHRIDLEGVSGYVRCAVRSDPSSRRLTSGAIAHVRCDPLDG